MTLHIEGFEQFANDNAVSGALARAGYGFVGSVPTVVGSRSGYGLSVTSGYVYRDHPWSGAMFSVGCGIRFTERAALLGLQFGDDGWVVLWMHPEDAQPRLNDAEGGSLPIINRFYYMEIELNRAAQTATLFINGKEEVSTSLTAAQAGASEIRVCLGKIPAEHFTPDVPLPQASVITYDDFYIRSGARFGPLEVRTRFPLTTDHNDWYLYGGDSASGILRERPPRPNDKYIGTDAAGKEARVISSDPLPNLNAVLATGLVLLTRRSANTDLRIEGFIGGAPGGAARRQQTFTPDTKWRMEYLAFEAVEGDNKDNIQAAPFGVESKD